MYIMYITHVLALHLFSLQFAAEPKHEQQLLDSLAAIPALSAVKT